LGVFQLTLFLPVVLTVRKSVINVDSLVFLGMFFEMFLEVFPNFYHAHLYMIQ